MRHARHRRALSPSIPNDEGTTTRPESPALEGIEPLPEEITGRASGTDESLTTLFDNPSQEHLRDGFQGGSGDLPEGGR
jgi:hypothetical protein